jgi:hypothetical protein
VGWWVIHICYPYITGLFQPRRKIMMSVCSHVCAVWAFWWCPLHALFVTKCQRSVYINQESCAVDFYHSIFMFLKCLKTIFQYDMVSLCLSVWCYIFIGISNVEFNQSVLVESIMNLVIILPHK